MTRQLNLNAFLMSTGHHEASWRLPESDPLAAGEVTHFQNLARIAERGKLDSVFFADSPSLFSNPARRPPEALEPTLLLAAMAVATERIGLVATVVDDVRGALQPGAELRLPRRDQPRAGRVERRHHGRPRRGRQLRLRGVAHPRRALRARQRVPRGRPRALGRLGGRRRRRRQGQWRVHTDPAKVHALDHRGKHFRVRGPLTVGRSEQGHPVVVQAGSSGPGIALAARVRRGGLHGAAHARGGAGVLPRAQGRDRCRPGATRTTSRSCPGIVPIIGDTEAEAQELERQLDELLVHEHALAAARRGHRHPGRPDRPRRAAAGAHPAGRRDRGQPDPLRAHGRLRPARQPHGAPDPVPPRWRTRAPHARPVRPSRSRTTSSCGSRRARPTAST